MLNLAGQVKKTLVGAPDAAFLFFILVMKA